MSRRGSGLAARFQNAVENAEAERTDTERDAAERAKAARLERDALLKDLAALGAELPIDSVDDSNGVVFRLDDSELRFLPKEDGSVEVDYSGRDKNDLQVLFQQAELGGRWVWSRTRRGRESRLPLFDQALELLLVHGLGLPDPNEQGVGSAAPASSSGDSTGDSAEEESVASKRTL